MQTRDFCYWLQGALELPGKTNDGLSAEQLEVIQDHLNMVFVHDLNMVFVQDLDPKAIKEKLQEAHDGKNNPSLVVRC